MKTKKKVKVQSRKTTHEIVVRVQPVTTTTEDLKPMQDGGKFMLPKTWMSEKQVLRMVQGTPKQHIYTRPAKGGGSWSYVTGNYVEKVLNYTFGWNWDFEVVAHGKEGDQIWVQGRLTVKDDHGHSISKSQFGRADIKFKRDKTGMLDYGNDLKAATTDALKKCASLLGIASDIYGKTEIKQETGSDVPDVAPGGKLPENGNSGIPVPKPGQIIGPDRKPTYVCSCHGDPISDQVYNYSMKIYKKALCRQGQEDNKKK